MTRLVYLVTDPMTADCFLSGHLAFLRSEGFEPHLVSAAGPLLDRAGERAGVTTHAVPFEREIRPLADFKVLRRLTALLRDLAPVLVNASTPKAGLLGLLAARRAGIPHRVYLVRGLRLETTRGLKRRLLWSAERRAARAATRIYCVSSSLRRRYIQLGLTSRDDVQVLLRGSSNGVSIERFASAREPAARRAAREALALPLDVPIVGFIGRLTRDKGIRDLVAAFENIVKPRIPTARLVLVGDFEGGDPVDSTTRRRIEHDQAIEHRAFVPGLGRDYAAFDVLAFPSYREGFPNVPLEAAACRLPVAGYRSTGTVDAVVDGVTGTLVEPGNDAALGRALVTYLERPDLRCAHGNAAFERVQRDFRPRDLWRAWRAEYGELIEGGA